MRFSASWEEGRFFAAFCVIFMWLNYLFLILVCLLVGWFFAEFLNFYSFLFVFPPWPLRRPPTFKMCLLGRNISVRHLADTLKTSCVLVTDVIWKYLVFDSTDIHWAVVQRSLLTLRSLGAKSVLTKPFFRPCFPPILYAYWLQKWLSATASLYTPDASHPSTLCWLISHW